MKRVSGAEEIAVVGTAGLRQAANSDEFLDAARERAGVDVEVIPGEEEARLSFLAAAEALPSARQARRLRDRRGQLAVHLRGKRSRDERFSLDLGAVPVTERFGLDRAVDEPTVTAAREAIASQLGPLDGRPPLDVLAGIGGAITNLAGVQLGLERYEPGRVRGLELRPRRSTGRSSSTARVTPRSGARSVACSQSARR